MLILNCAELAHPLLIWHLGKRLRGHEHGRAVPAPHPMQHRRTDPVSMALGELAPALHLGRVVELALVMCGIEHGTVNLWA